MRNPLKKLQKKINFRLASNAAQHSHIASGKTPSDLCSPTPQGNSLTSVTISERSHEDTLFNNRSSKLRLALAESRRAQNAQSEEPCSNASPSSTPKRKKGRVRLSFGGGKKSIQDDVEEHGAPPRIKPGSPSKAARVVPNVTTKDSPSKRPPREATSFDSPTLSSQLWRRDKAEVTHFVRPAASGPEPTVKSSHSKDASSQAATAKTKPPANGKLTLNDPNFERIAKAAAALDHTGNELFERGEYDKAMASYVKALKLKNRTLAKVDATNNEPDAPNTVLESIATKPPTTTTAPPSTTTATTDQIPLPLPDPNAIKQGVGADDLWISVATSINNIGYLRQQSGQASAEETMQAYQNSLQIKRRVLGKDNLSVGKTLNNLGTVHYLKREYEQALGSYGEALQIMLTTLGPRHLDVGTVHSNMGDVFWAQSGELKIADPNCSPQQFYQASRNAALQHYRLSLEIRWEELKNQRDPKIIRLLEKIAALEMGESFLALVQNNHKSRQSPKGAGTPGSPQSGEIDADEAIEAEGSKPVQEELQTLHEELRVEVKKMDMMERKMAIDMVKDKLRLIREMKKFSSLSIYTSDDDDEISIGSSLITPSKAPPLSPEQRTEALCAVKERLRLLRASRNQELEPLRLFPIEEVSDLKEADRSPPNFFLSHRAQLLLNRTLQPPAHFDGLDDLRKFSFNEVENNAEPEVENNPGPVGHDVSTNDVDGSHQGTNALDEGIDALRSLSVNVDNIPKEGNPWVIASTMESRAMRISPSKTPLSSSSMAAF